MANVAARFVVRRMTIEAKERVVRRDMAVMQTRSSGLRCLVVSIMYMVVMLKKKAISVVVGVGCNIILGVLIGINTACTVPHTKCSHTANESFIFNWFCI
jgi:hypothetical protein